MSVSTPFVTCLAPGEDCPDYTWAGCYPFTSERLTSTRPEMSRRGAKDEQCSFVAWNADQYRQFAHSCKGKPEVLEAWCVGWDIIERHVIAIVVFQVAVTLGSFALTRYRMWHQEVTTAAALPHFPATGWLRRRRTHATFNVINVLMSVITVTIYVHSTYNLRTDRGVLVFQTVQCAFYIAFYLVRVVSQNLTVSSVWTSKALVDVITVIPVLAQWGRPTILTQCYLRAIHVFWSWRRLAHTRRVEESLHPSVSVVILVVCKAFAMIMSFTGVIYTVETLGPFSPTFYSGLPDADCQSDHCFSFWTSFYYIMVTISTVGYGDYSTDTFLGQLGTSIFIVFGIIFFSGEVTNIMTMVDAEGKGKGNFPLTRGMRHMVVTGGGTAYPTLVSDFLDEYYHPDYGIPDTKICFVTPWLEDSVQALMQGESYGAFTRLLVGSLLRPRDQQRCRLDLATGCIVIANPEATNTDEEDSKNLLVAFSALLCNPNLHLSLQIVDSAHMHQAIAMGIHPDSIICIQDIKSHLMAKACLYPGFSTLMANIMTACNIDPPDQPQWQNEFVRGRNSEIYSTRISPFFAGMEFAAAATAVMRCRNTYQAVPKKGAPLESLTATMLLGIKLDNGTINLNPARFVFAGGEMCIWITSSSDDLFIFSQECDVAVTRNYMQQQQALLAPAQVAHIAGRRFARLTELKRRTRACLKQGISIFPKTAPQAPPLQSGMAVSKGKVQLWDSIGNTGKREPKVDILAMLNDGRPSHMQTDTVPKGQASAQTPVSPTFQLAHCVWNDLEGPPPVGDQAMYLPAVLRSWMRQGRRHILLLNCYSPQSVLSAIVPIKAKWFRFRRAHRRRSAAEAYIMFYQQRLHLRETNVVVLTTSEDVLKSHALAAIPELYIVQGSPLDAEHLRAAGAGFASVVAICATPPSKSADAIESDRDSIFIYTYLRTVFKMRSRIIVEFWTTESVRHISGSAHMILGQGGSGLNPVPISFRHHEGEEQTHFHQAVQTKRYDFVSSPLYASGSVISNEVVAALFAKAMRSSDCARVVLHLITGHSLRRGESHKDARTEYKKKQSSALYQIRLPRSLYRANRTFGDLFVYLMYQFNLMPIALTRRMDTGNDKESFVVLSTPRASLPLHYSDRVFVIERNDIGHLEPTPDATPQPRATPHDSGESPLKNFKWSSMGNLFRPPPGGAGGPRERAQPRDIPGALPSALHHAGPPLRSSTADGLVEADIVPPPPTPLPETWDSTLYGSAPLSAPLGVFSGNGPTAGDRVEFVDVDMAVLDSDDRAGFSGAPLNAQPRITPRAPTVSPEFRRRAEGSGRGGDGGGMGRGSTTSGGTGRGDEPDRQQFLAFSNSFHPCPEDT